MFSHFERMVAARYLRPRKSEGFISIIAIFSLLGIALGVATLIIVMAVMNGVRSELLTSIVGINGHIEIYGQGPALSDYDTLAAHVRSIEGVTDVSPLVEGQVMASNQGRSQGAMVRGFRYEDLMKKPLIAEKIVAGNIKDFADGEGIIIGARMAMKLGLRVGDEVTLISPEGRATIAGLMPRLKAYPVVAIFKLGMFAYDEGLVLMPFEEAQIYFKLKDVQNDNVSSLEVRVNNANDAAHFAKNIQQSLGKSYRVFDWQQTNAQIFDAVIVQRNVGFVILTLIIIVASFNIISSLIMLVRSKRRDIGILRTMGATRSAILRIFFTTGASIGVLGTLIGVVLGLAFALNIERIQYVIESLSGKELFANELYFLTHLPAIVEPDEVLIVIALSLGLSFLATLYPARRAASLDPAEVLRYE